MEYKVGKDGGEVWDGLQFWAGRLGSEGKLRAHREKSVQAGAQQVQRPCGGHALRERPWRLRKGFSVLA